MMEYPVVQRVHPRAQAGFTLIELLVVIAIIGILVGLLLPAVQAARESGRRSSCLNNIRQIAIAMQSYESANKLLPGWRNDVGVYSGSSGPGYPTAQTSWTVPILPQMGNSEAYEWFDQYDASNEDITRKTLPFYLCPSTPPSLVPQGTGPLCYVANGGSGGDEVRANSQQYATDGVLVDAVGSFTYGGAAVTGTTYLPGHSSFNASNDGSGDGTTLLLAERCGRNLVGAATPMRWTDSPQPTRTASGTAAAKSTNHIFMHPPMLSGTASLPSANDRVVCPNETNAPNSGRSGIVSGFDDDWISRYPSSAHSGDGVVAAFCDGHTSFLNAKIAPWVYCQLLTPGRADGTSPRVQQWVKTPAGKRYILTAEDYTR